MKIEKPAIWDGKWRVIIFDIFDIPDKYRKGARDALREKLKELNFYPFKKVSGFIPILAKKRFNFYVNFLI